MMGEDLGAEDVLRRCQMPEDEIRWVLTAEDPAVIHMILELHGERLEEELAERREALGAVGATLTERRSRGRDREDAREHRQIAVRARKHIEARRPRFDP